MRTILQLIVVGLITIGLITVESALAKSKDEVAGNCLSQGQARKAHPDEYLRYQAVGGARCWYAPGRELVAKKHHKPAVRAASARPIAAQPKAEIERDPPDDLDRVKEALCGGPCPRFDLDEPVYRALCGGLCPDFRTRFDDAFAAFGLRRDKSS